MWCGILGWILEQKKMLVEKLVKYNSLANLINSFFLVLRNVPWLCEMKTRGEVGWWLYGNTLQLFYKYNCSKIKIKKPVSHWQKQIRLQKQFCMGNDDNPPNPPNPVQKLEASRAMVKNDEKHYLSLIRNVLNPDTTTGMIEVRKTEGWPQTFFPVLKFCSFKSQSLLSVNMTFLSQSLVRTKATWKGSSFGTSFLTIALCWSRSRLE